MCDRKAGNRTNGDMGGTNAKGFQTMSEIKMICDGTRVATEARMVSLMLSIARVLYFMCSDKR